MNKALFNQITGFRPVYSSAYTEVIKNVMCAKKYGKIKSRRLPIKVNFLPTLLPDYGQILSEKRQLFKNFLELRGEPPPFQPLNVLMHSH